MKENILKIGILAGEMLSTFLIKTFKEIGYESFWINYRANKYKLLKELNDCDILYTHATLEPKVHILGKLFRKKIINHWIGTDVLIACTNKKYKFYAKMCDMMVSKQLVVSTNLKTELEQIGIETDKIIPIIPKFTSNAIAKIENKNKRFTVLTYLATERPEFYGYGKILKLAERHSDIDFWILTGKFDARKERKNIRYINYVQPNEMNDIYDKCHVLIRNVTHDGLPKMLIEALQKGLHVIYNFPFSHTLYCTTLNEIEAQILKLKNNYQINHAGRNFVLNEFNEAKINLKYIEILQSLKLN